MTTTSFRRNAAFERELRAQPEFVAGMRERTTLATAAIRDAAPRVTGYYIRHVRPDGTRIRIGDFAWHLVEYGSVNNPPYAPIRRGLRAAGLRFDDSRT